jgi:hypothetical protein
MVNLTIRWGSSIAVDANKDDPVLRGFIAPCLLAAGWANLARIASVNSNNLWDHDPNRGNSEAYNLQ